MENDTVEKKSKIVKSGRNVALNIRRETKKRIQAELTRLNKKDLGRTILADDFIAFAIKLITPEHVSQLQETSLSNADRLERDYKAYVIQFGQIPMDTYLGKRLNGEIESQKDSGPRDTSADLRSN